MSFEIRLYTLEKRDNSTKRPTGNGWELNCILKEGSSLINPTISIDMGITQDPSQYNYAHIPVFDRYYFIEDWYFDMGLWHASMRCDVLATYKSEIGSANLYVLRSSNAYDGRIIDNLYPQKTGCDFSSVVGDTIWGGFRYVIGVANQYPTIASLCYYVMSRAGLANFNQELMSNGFLTNNGFQATVDFTLDLQKAWVNPMQYIRSAIAIPYSVPSSDTRPADINGWSFALGSVPVLTTDTSIINIYRSFNIPKHPDSTSKGTYLNSSPFTIATLTVAPFGCIDLDTSVLANADTVDLDITLDALTGLGILTVWCNGVVLNRIEAQVGIPVSLSQVTRDYLGATTSILGAVGSATAGNVFGVAGSIGNAVSSLQPRAQTIGSGGGIAQLDLRPRLDMQFFRSVDDDLAHNGRPLCQIRNIASLGGYMIIQDGDVAITGTATEDKLIRSYLEGGFYYE